jgi:nitroreductase
MSDALDAGGQGDEHRRMDINSCDELLTTTRAVRRRLDLDRPVPRDVVQECIRIALQAPTGGNGQGWRWLVVTDPVKRAAIADLYRDAENGAFARREEKLRETDPQTSRVYGSAGALLEVLDRVPVLVVPCALGRVDGMANAATAGYYGSILPAVWSFMLALRARGLGSVWVTLQLLREKEMAELLGIPDDVSQVAMVPVAYTVGTDFKPAKRKPMEEVTYWDSWGTTQP